MFDGGGCILLQDLYAYEENTQEQHRELTV